MEAATNMCKRMMMMATVIGVAACGRVVPLEVDDATGDGDGELTADPGGGSSGDGDGDATGSGSEGELDLDTAGPTITLHPSRVKDERGDQIDFSTGEPVHQHAGSDVELTETGCPAIYKYGYLAPGVTFGEETSPNPLAWPFTVTDPFLDASATMFRVRTEAGQVVADWTPAPASDGSGVQTIALSRATVPALGLSDGKYVVDVRARDRNGNETIASWCWDHHVLQAPLDVGSFDDDELLGWHFSTNDPISRITRGMPTRVVQQRYTQFAAEPVTVVWSAAQPAVSYRKTTVNDIVGEERNDMVDCSVITTGVCANTAFQPPGPESSVSGIAATSLRLSLFDENGMLVVSSTSLQLTATIPARSPGALPHTYTLVLSIGPVAELGPSDGGEAYREHVLLGNGYTGRAPVAVHSECWNWQWPRCMQWVQYWQFEALDHASLQIERFTLGMKVGGAQSVPQPPPHVPADWFTLDLTWEPGNDDVPGFDH